LSQTFLEISFEINQEIVDTFFKQVEKTDCCWNWLGPKNPLGYGQTSIHSQGYKAHRVSYYLKYGYIDEYLTIDHLCKNPSCVNPDHLELVTQRENVLRSDNQASKNAKKQFCLKGHKLSGENLLQYPDGRRGCKICITNSFQNFKTKTGLEYFRNANKIHRQKLKLQFGLIKSRLCIDSKHTQCKGIITQSGGKCLCQCH